MFPTNAIPNRASLVRHEQVGFDANGNAVFEPVILWSDRPCRRYRDEHAETPYVRQGVNVRGTVSFKWHDGDELRGDDLLVVDGKRLGVVYANRRDSWSKPVHWEVVVKAVD